VTEPSRAVFLSYASQDAQAAQKICEALRTAGIEVWFDRSELRGGDAWDHSIRRQIKSCALFVAVISKNTHHRDEGYFRLEWKLAVDRCHLMAADRTFLLPVVVDDTRDDDERVPERFREVQWTRLPGGETPPGFVERIRRLLAPAEPHVPTLGDEATGPVSTATTPTKVSASASWSKRVLPIAATVVALGAIAYLAVDRPWTSTPAAASPPSASPAPAVFAPPPHSIAVLPFLNMSGDVKQEYFSDGVTEEILNSLSRLNDLEVMARTSSFSFKGQNVDITTIAHKLNVGAILEGSVRRDGRTVRITVQLINAVNGFHMWSQTYDQQLTDILKVQSDVATSVAQQLEVKLVGDEAAKIELGGTRNPEAYDAYLHGVQLIALGGAQQSQAEYLAAFRAFDEAIALDPKYASAYAGRAESAIGLAFYEPNLEERNGLRHEARSAAERAITLAPGLGEAHLALARVLSYEFLDIGAAAQEFDRALVSAPGSARVQRGFARFASMLGHFEMALKAARQAVFLDPQNPSNYVCLAGVLHDARRYAEEIEVLHHAQALSPDSNEIGGDMAGDFLASHRTELARQYCESASSPMVQWGRHYCLALAYHALGRQRDAERQLQQLMALGGGIADAIPYAGIYAQWGDKAAAMQWLVTAERVHDPTLMQIKVDEELDPIRNEPAFRALQVRMNFPP